MATVRQFPKKTIRQRATHRGEMLPPQSREAEAAVIGAILIDRDAVGIVRGIVQATHFYTTANREIVEAIYELDDAGVAVDLVTLSVKLEEIGKLEELGGYAALSEYTNRVPTSANVEHYARIVAKLAAKRAARKLSTDLAMLSNSDGPIAELVEFVEGAAKDLRGEYGGLDGELLPIVLAKEVRNQIPPIGILGDILFENTVAILYGASGRWKTFVALGMAASLASGEPWLGRPVRKFGPVVYIAAEGGGAIGKRIRALEIHHGREISDQLHILRVPVNLLHAEAVDLLIRSIEVHVGSAPVALFIDTLSRSMAGGDGNANQDGGLVMDAACRLRDTFGCNVTLLAHPGKDASKGISGWLGYFNNSDTVIKIESDATKTHLTPGDVVKMVSEKPKDSEEFADITLTAEKVSWTLDDGTPTNSLVMVAAEAAPLKPEKLPVSIQIAIVALQQAGDSGLTRSEIAVYAKPYGVSKSSAYGAVADMLRLDWATERIGKLIYATEKCPEIEGEPPALDDL